MCSGPRPTWSRWGRSRCSRVRYHHLLARRLGAAAARRCGRRAQRRDPPPQPALRPAPRALRRAATRESSSISGQGPRTHCPRPGPAQLSTARITGGAVRSVARSRNSRARSRWAASVTARPATSRIGHVPVRGGVRDGFEVLVAGQHRGGGLGTPSGQARGTRPRCHRPGPGSPEWTPGRPRTWPARRPRRSRAPCADPAGPPGSRPRTDRGPCRACR